MIWCLSKALKLFSLMLLIDADGDFGSSEALELVSIRETDAEILDRLFSMFDKTGNDQINYKEFVVGLAPLCDGTIEEKLACEWRG